MMPAPRIARAGGAAFSFLENGSGAPLVLLHGIGSGARSWKLQLTGLASHFRVIAWDAPGYGESDPLPAAHPVAADYASALARLLDQFGVTRMHLVGHSLGTVVALAFAAAHQGRIASLTLASLSTGHARLDEAERKRLRDARLSDLAALGPAGMAQKRGPRLLGPGATEEQKFAVIETMSLVRPAGYTQAAWMLSQADTRADLLRLPAGMPVQVVFGDADIVTPPDSIRSVAAARPQVPLHAIAGAGHAVYLERPGEFNELICRFAGVGGL
jgi:pimeloyl-ACP methyl ester carboxylesterase